MSIYRGSNEVDLFWRNGKPVNKVKYGGVDVLNRLLVEKQALHPEVNFTRNTDGGYWDENGIFQRVGNDVPRFNFNPATGLYEGLTIMGQWTNEILDPRDMTTGNWSGNTTITRNAVGIDGNANTANTVEDTSGSAFHSVIQSVAVSDDSQTHTYGIYIKKDSNTSRFPLISFDVTGGTTEVSNQIYFNTSTGAYQIREGSDTFEVTDDGDYWGIYGTVTNNGSGNTTARLRLFPAFTDNIGSDSNTTGSCIADVASIFLNRSSPPPTPVYGETAGQSYTQDPDIATAPDLDAIDFNPQEGTFVSKTKTGGDVQNVKSIYYVNDNSFNNRISVYIDSENLTARISNSGTNYDISTSVSPNTEYNIGLKYKEGEAKLAVDGTIVGTSSPVLPSGLARMDIGTNQSGSNNLDGFYKDLLNYPGYLTDAQLQQLTS